MKFCNKINFIKISLSFLFVLTILFSQIEQPYPPLDLVSIPTSGTLPKGSFTLEALLINGGGVLPKLSIGITDHFFIGLSYGIQDFISEKKPTINKPTPEIQIRYRLYEETQSFPAIVIGLDTQGKGRFLSELYEGGTYYHNFDRYEQKAVGAYIVCSKNWNFGGNLGLHIGFNKNTWESDPYSYNNESNTVFRDKDLNFFFGIDKEINRSFSFLLEYDAAMNDNFKISDGFNLFGKGKGYLNLGLRWTVAENLMLEIDFKDISKNYVSQNDMDGEKEYSSRELKIIYFEKF
tara:strand:- start:44 stop:919 length:876 start_codon:yes stop_codon:yes gene_type:complete